MVQHVVSRKRHVAVMAAICLAAAITAAPQIALGQFDLQDFGRNQIGGVRVDAQGAVRNLDRGALKELQQVLRNRLEQTPAELCQEVQLRRISLKQIQLAAMGARKLNGAVLPDAVRFLGGLQRIRYVLVYPELHDIVLVGPAEGWKIAETGEAVGLTTGRAVMQFDDLVVALRTAAAARREPITCSIDSTPEGIRKLHAYLQTQPAMTSSNKARILGRAENELGIQKITLSGVDPTSHFANVLVAADYRMKRLAMGFDSAPIKGMPSYLQLASTARQKSLMPRWWLEDDYQPLLTDEQGLTWEIRGQGIKCMTEDEAIGADGTRRGTGKQDPVAAQWAKTMTEKYDELSGQIPVFGQLRNCMDVAVVAALIVSEDLAGKAGLDLSPALSSPLLTPDQYNEPRELPALASALEKQHRWLISVSGGVSIDPWRNVSHREKSDKLVPIHDKSLPPAGATWWWN